MIQVAGIASGLSWLAYVIAVRSYSGMVTESVLTIITAASAGPAPKSLETTGNPIFNAFWTYVGTPCITLPLLEADGMPLGVQLVGARRDDSRLLRNARLFERQLAEMA